MRKVVTVVPYDPRWPLYFAAEKDQLEAAVATIAVHHIGSTSVPGLSAKPVIDVLVEVAMLDVLDESIPALLEAGYESRGEYGIPGRRYLVRRPEASPRVHVHCFTQGHERAIRHLAFRDYLRQDTTAAGEYDSLKRELAARHPDDRESYQAGKESLVAEIHRRVGLWR